VVSGVLVSELTLLILRIGFLIALWVFVFFVVYAVRSDLFGQRVRKMPVSPQPVVTPDASAFLTSAQPRVSAPQSSSELAPADGTPLKLVITSGALQGQELPLQGDVITIGRSPDSSVVIQDDYTSTHHARLETRGGNWLLRDLDSTNGTTLAGARVTSPTPIPLNTPIVVGSMTFEVRR
jgi:pSer/pThr/pTyr-binding forkhead associated (FHA) protein